MNWIVSAAIVLSAIGMAAFYYLMNYAPKSPHRLQVEGQEFRMPDVRFRYSPAELYATFDQAGEDGLPRMRRFWWLDFGFIACFLVVMLAIGVNVAGRNTTLGLVMTALAAVRATLDVLENALLLRLAALYPKRSNGLAGFASVLTSAKFLCLCGWVGILFYQLFTSAFHIQG